MIDCLYEDNHLLVLNKPASVLTQPSGTNQENLQDEARRWLKLKYDKPGQVFLEPIHRLDKPVSGVVLFAKTSKALSRLNESLRNRQMRKFYLAWVQSEVAQSQELIHYLVHGDHCAKLASPSDEGAKKACLNYRVVERKHNFSLVEVELKTGRYHQIRAQFSAINAPILGDSLYGSEIVLSYGKIALHHFRLHCEHPIKKEPCLFEAPLPSHFKFRLN